MIGIYTRNGDVSAYSTPIDIDAEKGNLTMQGATPEEVIRAAAARAIADKSVIRIDDVTDPSSITIMPMENRKP